MKKIIKSIIFFIGYYLVTIFFVFFFSGIGGEIGCFVSTCNANNVCRCEPIGSLIPSFLVLPTYIIIAILVGYFLSMKLKEE